MTAARVPVASPVHHLPAQVLFATVGVALAQASRALADGARDIDLSACTDFDSSLLALLLELQRQGAGRGVPPRLVGVPPNLRKLAALYGAEALLFPAE
jgi:phospholipid transport system transporter-binding protein